MPDHVFEAAFKAACNAKVIRFEKSRRARGNPPDFTLERVFGTTNVDAINALSEGDFQDAIEKAKAAAGLKRSPAAEAASVAKSTATQAEKRRAEKAANNGKHPKFKANPSCPDFETEKNHFPIKFGAHLEECESCRNWAYRVSQLQAAPVGKYPSTLTVVKCAAKLQEKGVTFLGRIDVKVFTARRDAAKPKKRRGAKGAAPPAKRPKK